MKGARYAWASSLRKLMRYLGFTLCRDGEVVWMKVAVDTLDIGATTDDEMP